MIFLSFFHRKPSNSQNRLSDDITTSIDRDSVYNRNVAATRSIPSSLPQNSTTTYSIFQNAKLRASSTSAPNLFSLLQKQNQDSGSASSSSACTSSMDSIDSASSSSKLIQWNAAEMQSSLRGVRSRACHHATTMHPISDGSSSRGSSDLFETDDCDSDIEYFPSPLETEQLDVSFISIENESSESAKSIIVKQESKSTERAVQDFDSNKYVGIIKKWRPSTGVGNKIVFFKTKRNQSNNEESRASERTNLSSKV